ncbi:hypothetical protein [Xanthomonas campestris]|uniref:hypothetical protein n=1 Tax=Xanthomonas campestris TaxID=339 RepID=UPI001C6F531C|nr:hypothetical protein [Xanthomonas campestris]MEA9577311.1 hypothetical protein [Xanthomonas campestris]
MSIYMVSYRLKKLGKDYEALVSKIKQIGSPWWQDLESTWLIGHLGNASTIRDVLKVYLRRATSCSSSESPRRMRPGLDFRPWDQNG